MPSIPLQVYVTVDQTPSVAVPWRQVKYGGTAPPLDVYPSLHVKNVVDPIVVSAIGVFALARIGPGVTQ